MTINDSHGSQATATKATVAGASLTATGKRILSGSGTTFNGAVATFTDANPNGTVSDYTATIDWGDGTAPSAGTISSGSSFALGDKTVATAIPGATLTWWGAHWASQNALSNGAAPAAFNGFIASLSTTRPTCGATWTTGPSSSPPSSVPAYMAVAVPSTVTRSGNTISGNSVHIEIVKTNPGYSPNRTGTGTIVAQLC